MDMILLLDTTYEPLTVVGWQRAITLVFSGKAEILEESEKEIRSQRFTMKMPAVVRLLHKAKTKKRQSARFTRNNLFHRDDFTCQYCYQKFDADELTFDHVIPVVHGGRKTWDNIVTACEPCNSRKEGRTPEQAGMKLLRKPKQPAWSQVVNIMIGVRKLPEIWKNYLYQGV